MPTHTENFRESASEQPPYATESIDLPETSARAAAPEGLSQMMTGDLGTREGAQALRRRLRERFHQGPSVRVSGKRCGLSGKQCGKFPVSRVAKRRGET